MPDRDAARRYRSIVPKRSPAQMIDALHQAIEDSHKSLNKIGEGDWTPQDTAHSVLLARIEVVLANVPFRTGRIVHGDADA